MQSKLHSAIESATNIAVGYVVALLSQLLVFPMFDIHVSFSENLAIGAWFTAIWWMLFGGFPVPDASR